MAATLTLTLTLTLDDAELLIVMAITRLRATFLRLPRAVQALQQMRGCLLCQTTHKTNIYKVLQPLRRLDHLVMGLAPDEVLH